MADGKRRFSIAKDGRFYKIYGYVNEHSSFQEVPVSNTSLLLDMSEIEYINSIGCKNWITFIDAHKDREIEYHSVSIPMMTGISMLPGLMPPKSGKSAIKSFHLPFNCMNCNQLSELKIEAAEIRVEDGSAFVDMHACPICGSPAVITEQNSEFLYLYV